MRQIPESLSRLLMVVRTLEQEARDLRDQNRVALAISVEREVKEAQREFEMAALAYRKLGTI